MTTGTITGVNGNLISVAFEGAVALNEIGYAILPATGGSEELRLMSEIVRIRGRVADMQVFEDTAGLKAGHAVEFTTFFYEQLRAVIAAAPSGCLEKILFGNAKTLFEEIARK